MKIYEFIAKYCQDLVDANNLKKEVFDFSEFIHDDVITDITGAKVPIIYIEGEPVPIADIITMAREDFVKTYKMASAGEMYDNYISTLSMLEGEEVINHVRNTIAEEQRQLELNSTWMLSI